MRARQIRFWFLSGEEDSTMKGKPLRAEYKTNKLNPHVVSSPELNPVNIGGK